MAYDTRPHDWSIRSNSEAKNSVKEKFVEKNLLLRKKLSFKCLVLCKSYQLVVYVTINYIKRIMLERENTYELTDVLLILFTCCTFVNPQNMG